MVKCLKCSNECGGNLRFCPYCGNDLVYNNSNANRHSQYVIKNKRLEISLLLAIFLPGISYFYLELWHRGVLFYLTYVLLFVMLGIKAGFYTFYTKNIDLSVLVWLIMILYFLLYVFQIFDVLKKTNMINDALIRF